jgi:type II secretory pathway pseudopilin PulG
MGTFMQPSNHTFAPTRLGRMGHQHGLSLVELMVGIAVGLFVVAAASLVVSSQLNDNRKLLLELQVQQDLRATADIVSRELRRAGYWEVSQAGIANPAIDPSAKPIENPYLNLTASAGSGAVSYEYKRPSSDEGPFGFELTTSGVIRTRLTSQSGFQELTDINTLVVDTFAIVKNDSLPIKLPCPADCPGASIDACWPTVTVRGFTVTITGHAPSDTAITRTITTQVRLRNDEVKYFPNPVPPAVPAVCPV